MFIFVIKAWIGVSSKCYLPKSGLRALGGVQQDYQKTLSQLQLGQGGCT